MDLLEKYHFYINLSERIEKNLDTITELKNFGIKEPNRFNAIKDSVGLIGCVKSHIKCIEIAKERDYPYVCIFEDDIVFRDIENCKSMIKKYINYDYDVLYLGCLTIDNKYDFIEDDLIRVKNVRCNHAYIVKSHYYDKILNNYNMGMKLKENDKDNEGYNMDIFLNILRKKDKWYSLYPNFVSQKAGYSDILNKGIDIKDEIFNMRIHDSKLPYISLLTPTFNRKKFLELMIHNIKHFTYPKEKIEWNILESNDKNLDDYEKLFDNHPLDLERDLGIKIKYVYTDRCLKIGEKRNILCASSKNEYLINMDDDDIYLPDYLNYSIEILINEKKDITSCLDMLFVYPNNNFKTSYIRCVRDYKLYHEATMCMKRSHWKKYKYIHNSQGEGRSVSGDDSVCGISHVMKCMICVCWDGNTVNKDMFSNYPIDIEFSGNSFDVIKKLLIKILNDKDTIKDKDKNKTELILNKDVETIEIPLELLKNIRLLIEKTNQKIKWDIKELLPIGLMIRDIDRLLKNTD